MELKSGSQKSSEFGPRLPRAPSGEFGMNSPNLLGQTGRLTGFGLNKRPQKSTDIYPPSSSQRL